MKETTKILRSLGFNSVDSQADYPKAIGLLNLKITYYGNRIFCHGGFAEYDLIRSHLPGVRRDVETLTVGDVPILCATKEKLALALRSIAIFRILAKGKDRQRARHQVIANKLAKRWIAQIPLETDLIGEATRAIEA